jgi:hypothetical protein
MATVMELERKGAKGTVAFLWKNERGIIVGIYITKAGTE